MRRKITIVLLSVGTFAGFAWGAHGMHHHHRHHEAMARVCVDAALAVRDDASPRSSETEDRSHWEQRVRQLCAAAARRRAG